MTLTVQTFREIMIASLPDGPMWPRSEDSEWAVLFEAIASEFVLLDQLNAQLIDEMTPASASLLFDEWEAELGLPGTCALANQTLSQRRQAMVDRYYFEARQDAQFFIDLAASIGFAITIEEFSASNPGPAGSLLVHKPSGETFHVSPSGNEWNYVWRVNAPSTGTTPRQYGSTYGEPYTDYGNSVLECTLRKYAHDHRVLIFAYV